MSPNAADDDEATYIFSDDDPSSDEGASSQGATSSFQLDTNTVEDITTIDEESEDSSFVPTQRSTDNSVGVVNRFSKGELFRLLNQQIPLNEYNIPEYIYRADLIPAEIDSYDGRMKQKVLEAAAVRITFDHGYPALNETSPFWEQLPAESPDAFNAFMVYLELPEKSNHENPIRILPMIAQLINTPLDRVTEWCHMFYWHYRSRSYDLFLIACHRKQREQRIMSIEGKHFQMAEKYLSKVALIIDAKLEEAVGEIGSRPGEGETSALDDMKIKDVVDIMERLVKIQRVSVGLSATGHSDEPQVGPRHGTINDQLKAIAKESAGEKTGQQRPPEMDDLLKNPDDLAAIQDLIVRHQNAI